MENFEASLAATVGAINGVLWDKILIVMLIGAGLWFTLRLGAVQFRLFGHMFGVMKGSLRSNKLGISPFQALATSLAARVGTGNLAGVAVAITLGGPGAVFWMWVIALMGMATGFAESTLGQFYKVKDANGEYRGGPAYYIQMGLNNRWLAILFSLCLLFGYGFVFSAVQANTIGDALNNAYGISPFQSGLVMTVVAGLVLIGGLRAIATFAEITVPFMGLGYVLMALTLVAINIAEVPDILALIVKSAFGLEEAAGGFLGAAINGIKRGLYSNEAGSGSVPHAAAAAVPYPNHPVSQGLVQMLGVFVDTIIICSCTAIIILLAHDNLGSDLAAIRVTQEAMVHHVGSWGMDFIAVTIVFFSFTSVIANYAYAESNLHMFKLDNRLGRLCLIAGYLVMVLWGSMAKLQTVWDLADMALGLMTVINVIAIVWLTPTVKALLNDYLAQRKANKLPEYTLEKSHRYQGEPEAGVWSKAD
ncbi:alanine/glycine:cation symporter family protein [Simiduia agarivorans]|uniref:Amino acid carrier protein n=1 Tax=Simiduia agarivorans (strain DSM 21679 / JCM 13881 / BCRC 17597 / SA1) TaxID=1117647 RepID=K4KVJ9_SIMAS|nr:alanine/glycine:cation symporter family protein [Simiduia agarivorans]AFU97977.1 amino acid carrier protein [Simiduia agarivorans SA1 = DSM 21679]